MKKPLSMNPAVFSTALTFSPQIALDGSLGSVLGMTEGHIPPGVEVVDDTHFRLNFFAPTASEVALRTFQGSVPLVKGESGVWTAELEIGDGGIRPLFFTVDGVNVLNPMAPVGFGASAATNMAELPAPDGDYYALKDVPHGAVTQEFYPSSVTGRFESCFVYTPPGYMRGGSETYPVLYLQHGHGENERCWVYQGKMNFILDNLLASGEAVPCIVVMNNGMVQEDSENGARINSELLESLLLQDCIPFIERSYRVKTDRLSRAMAGLSMGSLQTSMITLYHPELFAWAGVFSGFMRPLLGLSKRSDYLLALDNAEKFGGDYRLFFRAIGLQDPFYSKFEEETVMMEEKNLSPEKCPIHKIRTYHGSHEWNVWRQCIRDFLKLVFH